MGWIVDRNAGIVRPAPCEPESVFKTIRYEANESKLFTACVARFLATMAARLFQCAILSAIRIRSCFVAEDNWVRSTAGKGNDKGGEVKQARALTYSSIFSFQEVISCV